MSRLTTTDEWGLHPLNPASEIPLHMQTERLLRDRISSGQWHPGMKMPSERTLMTLLNVSRTTIRQALDALLYAGLLDRRHGSGTYVAPLRFVQPMNSVYSFTEQFRQRGVLLENQVRRCEVLPADAELAERLHIELGEDVVYLQRLRSVRGAPIMLNFSYTPLRLVPSLASETDYLSLYSLLTEKYGLGVHRAQDFLESVPAAGEIASLLGVRRNAPLMLVDRTAYTRVRGGEEVPLQVGRNYIRGDACRFQTELTGLIYKDAAVR
jgi:GntR family transcriptional regulator